MLETGDTVICINSKPWVCPHAPYPHAQPGPAYGETCSVTEGGAYIRVRNHPFRYDANGFSKLAGERKSETHDLEIAI